MSFHMGEQPTRLPWPPLPPCDGGAWVEKGYSRVSNFIGTRGQDPKLRAKIRTNIRVLAYSRRASASDRCPSRTSTILGSKWVPLPASIIATASSTDIAGL
jgi:hypothetical protein